MFGYATILLLLVGSSSGSIMNCCHQGEKIGSRQSEAPQCLEKNLDYSMVGRVNKGMCMKVFLSCCQHSAMEQYCKLGVGSAINGQKCSKASGLGGDMKSTCCLCCKQGMAAAGRGDSCEAKQKGETLCDESFKTCCTNAGVTMETTKNPLVTAAPVKVLNCSNFGCEQRCSESSGDVTCECNSGYRLKKDSRSCEDIDECKEGTASCDSGNFCQNQPGSYICVKQPDPKKNPCSKDGYVRNSEGKCVDEDECATGSAVCRNNQYCLNTDGYYACFRSCPYGYKQVGRICQDVDECAISNPCRSRFKCVNKKGHYSCVLASCPSGYQLRNERCEDIDECALNTHKCGERYSCRNTPGFYKCELSSCVRGFRLLNGRCVDLNECRQDPDICGQGRCYNSYGGYSCGCFTGYRFNSRTTKCEDIDECKRSPGICEFDCVNTQGSYRCLCPQGYQPGGNNCEDIDECSLFSNRCPSDHVCVNEHGNFTCINASCPSKYYIQRSPYECKLFCPGSKGKCSDMIIRSIKWTATKFRKTVFPRQFQFSYTLRVSSYLNVQLNFALVSGNEGGEFYLQKRSENTVDIINIRKITGPRRYVLRLDADIMYNGKVTSKYVYFNYISVSKYSF